MLKLRYGHADPRDAGVGNIVNCGAAMYIAPVGIANAGDPDARVRRGDRPDGRAPVELRPRGGGRAGGRASPRRCGPDATVDGVVDGRAAPREGRDARPRSRRSRRPRRRSTAGATAASRRCGPRSRRSTRSASTTPRPAQNARIPSRLHSIEELPIALGLLVATGGDYAETMLGGVNYGRDSDSIASMGGALAGALGGVARCRASGSRRSRRRAGSTSRRPGREMAAVAVEIFATDAAAARGARPRGRAS